MECNKDEATRAKSIAESKLEQKDFVGARKFALKAQTLYPELYGITNMLTTLDVYLAAENKISGEVDWYGVLGVNPSADEGAIKKQFRKLALLLHPDKNSTAGADGAFRLISEGWSLLADKEKRMAYDRRMGMGSHRKVPAHPAAPCKPHQHNIPLYPGGQSIPPTPSEQKVPSAPPKRSQKKAPSAPLDPSQQKVPQPGQASRRAKVPGTPNPSPFNLRSDTFWTTCRGCNIYWEYLKIYTNATLLCAICQKPFLALATSLPVRSSKSGKRVPWLGRENSLRYLANRNRNAYHPERNAAAAQAPVEETSFNSFTYVTYQDVPFPGTANAEGMYPFPGTANAEGMYPFPGTANAEGMYPFPGMANAEGMYPSTAAGYVDEQQAHDNLNRSHTESHASAGMEGCFKKVNLDDDSNTYGVGSQYMGGGNGDFETRFFF